ncbi:MAG: choice-of-anchor Q domain-containing protein, partial [Halanaerobiales bacterium]
MEKNKGRENKDLGIIDAKRSVILIFISLLLFMAICSMANAKDIFVAQTALGDGSGIDKNNTRSVNWFNDSSNWGEGEDKISPGTTVHLCGTISTGLSIREGGIEGQPITIFFEPDAKLSAPLWDIIFWDRRAPMRIWESDYIIIDGGTNGVIESTDNGTELENKETQMGVWLYGSHFCEVKNLTIRDMYVRIPRSDDDGSGIGINAVGCTHLKIHDNVISEAQTGIAYNFPGNKLSEDVKIYRNRISRVSNGITCGSGNVNALGNDFRIYDNDISDSFVWDGVRASDNHWFHSDGIQVWAVHEGSKITNLFIYNNHIHGDMGEHITGWIFTEGNIVWPNIFNNILFNVGTSYPSNGMITSSGNIYNNTIVMFNPGIGIKCGTKSRIKNNILYNSKYPIAVSNPEEATEIDYNLFFPLDGIKNAIVGTGGTFSFQSFERWKEFGFDLNSQTSDPDFINIDEYDFHIGQDSSARDSGDILPDIFTIDKDGTRRPQGEGWDIGAYEYNISDLTIIKHPEPQIGQIGESVSFLVIAEGLDIEYQWQKRDIDGFVNLQGENTAILTIRNVQNDDAGEYRVVVSNSEGTVTSNNAALTVIDTLPMILSFNSISEYFTNYLYWENPEQTEEWDKVVIIRKNGNEPTGHTDGDIIYEGIGNSLVDRNLTEGSYYYTAYTSKESDGVDIYSKLVTIRVDIPEIYNKDYLMKEADQQNEITIGQNTRGDLYSLWNNQGNILGKGPGGNETDLWVYSDLIGNGEDQIPAGSTIVSASLVFSVDNSYFDSGNEEVNFSNDNANSENNINEGTVNNSSPHSIKAYQITDPDNLGTPYFADESGLRVGLDFNYRDHRPGINKPWLNSEDDKDDNLIDNTADNTYDKSILDLFTGSEEGTEDAETPVEDIDLNSDTDRYAIDSIEFYPDVFENELLDTIRFDITEAVQAWAIGNSENQGLFITTGQGWKNDVYLTLSGMTAEDEDKRPYIEVIYSDNDSADLIAPESVGEVTIEPGPDSITLNWT